MRVTKLQSRQAIPVYLEIVRMLGHDHLAALYFQQLRFYEGLELKDAQGYFKKNKRVFENDTELTRFQQDRARAKLTALGWIESRADKFKILRSL